MRNPLSDKIVNIQPSGIRKFFDIVNEMKDAISLGVGEPDFDTPWRIREEGIYSMERGRTFYTSNAGLKELKEEICVFFYDAEIYQNFLSQYLQLRGIQTATLQHGIMLAPRPEVKNNIDFAGIEFNSFTSNYFLAWNKFTKSEAIKAGIPESKIKILGIAKCINKTSINTSFSNKKIGIILDGKFEMENNIPLIKIVDSFSRKNGYTYILRYHPNFIGNEYDSFIDSTIGENCNKNISLEDFLQQISFCVVANSTVLFELEYYQVPFLRYKTNDMKDKYRDYPSITFINEKEFKEGVTKLMRYPNCNNCNDNIQLSYKLFLESFL